MPGRAPRERRWADPDPSWLRYDGYPAPGKGVPGGRTRFLLRWPHGRLHLGKPRRGLGGERRGGWHQGYGPTPALRLWPAAIVGLQGGAGHPLRDADGGI